MSANSKIQWTEHSWNPIRGCTRVSRGCENCYAERVAGIRHSGPGRPYEGFAERTSSGPRWTGKVELIPGKLDEPLRWRAPRKVFVNSMSDMFHEELSDEDIAAVFGVMAASPQHTFQVLTKRPARMLDWFERIARPDGHGVSNPGLAVYMCAARTGIKIATNLRFRWPLPNAHIGVSVEDQATADERIPLLLQTPAAVRWASAEPLIAPVKLFGFGSPTWGKLPPKAFLSWVVAGGESGPNHRPADPDWFRSVRDQCQSAGVPFFMKQVSGSRPKDEDIPEDLMIREWPGEAVPA